MGLIAFAFLLSACQSSPGLEAGRWTGTLTPMNHSEMKTPVSYDVRREGAELAIDLIGPGGAPVSTRNPRLEGDTLFFAFSEPEEQVPLKCALGAEKTGGYAGKCIGPSGKWARFTMSPPGRQ
jgi:hypothetical protein